MSWNNIIGQLRVKELLQRAYASNHLAHAYLFYGPEGCGKEATAMEFAKALNCERNNGEVCDACETCRQIQRLQHPNIKVVFALPGSSSKDEERSETITRGNVTSYAHLSEEIIEIIHEQIEQKAANPYFHIQIPKAKEILIKSVREIIRELSMTQFTRGTRVIIVFDAHLINEEAANAFLKTLEEPPHSTIIILTTSRKDKMLQTIVSRCQQIPFEFLKSNEIANALIARKHVSPLHANLIAQLANGSFTRALELLGEKLMERRTHLLNFLRTVASKNDEEIVEAAETISKEFSREELVQYLILMVVWFRDVMMMQCNGTIMNIDQKETLLRFVQRYPNINSSYVIKRIEQTLLEIDKNVYARLLVTSLALDLRTHFLDSVITVR
jgi:DNA polymerase-3 subunit delta'